MATFVLVRHAKAERPAGVADPHRELTERGRHDAGLIGSFLGAALPTPRLVLTSPARRASQTADLVVAAAGWDVAVLVEPRLYHGGVDDLLHVLRGHPTGPVVAFGHQPTWSAAAETLIGGGSLGIVTGAAVCLDGVAAPGAAILRWLITPAALGGGAS